MAIDVNYEFDISKWPVLKISAKDIYATYGPLQTVYPKWTGLPYYASWKDDKPVEPTKPQSVDEQIRYALNIIARHPSGLVASEATLASPTFMNVLSAVPELKELLVYIDNTIVEGELRINFGYGTGLLDVTYRVFTLYTPAGGNDTWSK